MKKFRKKLIRFSIPAVVILLIAGGIAYSKYFSQKQPEYSTAKVVKGDIVRTVSETGTVKASEELNLQFLASGKLNKLNKQVGDQVKEGEVLAELDLKNAGIQIKQAEAQLYGAKASLSKLINGASAEDIRIAENSAKQAEVSYKNAQDSLNKIKTTTAESLAQAQKNYDDLKDSTAGSVTPQEQAAATAQTALENLKSTLGQASDQQKESTLISSEDKLATGYIALDEVKKILDDDDFENLFSVKNSSYQALTASGHDLSIQYYNSAKTSLAAAKSFAGENEIKAAAAGILDFLEQAAVTLNACYKALENSITSASFTQTSLDAYKTTINTKLSAVNTAISSLKTSEQALNSAILSYHTRISDAESALKQAKSNYENALISASNSVETAKKSKDQQISAAEAQVKSAYEAWQTALAQVEKIKAPARTSDIALAQSQVLSAQAGLEAARKAMDDATIKAPVDGLITKSNYKAGEIVSSLNPAISMIGINKEYVEIDISETDIEDIKAGDRSEITLDAFGDEAVLSGEAYFIDPAQTVIQDVVYYKIKVKFDEAAGQPDDRAREVLSKIKPGMTANVILETDRTENVLIMPARAVIDKDGKKFTRIIKEGNRPEEVEIVLGLSGDEGMVELVSGVNEGQDVITFIKE